MNINNFLITGGSGMIGYHIPFGIKPSSEEMNITIEESINKFINKTKNIECIIHLAAINLRECETNNFKAIDVNINGTINMLKAAMKLNVPFVLLSTGAVFSSKNYNMTFDEQCIVSPNSYYGYTKASAEKIALIYDKTILIRTGWLFGGNQKNHYKFVETVINNLITNNEVKGSNDFYGSPTYVSDLIDNIIRLIKDKNYGIHHIVNSGIATGYDIAIEICKLMNKNELLIKSVKSCDVPNPGPNRSNSEILTSIYDTNKLRDWKEPIKEYLNKYLNNKYNNETILTSPKKQLWCNRDKCRLCDSYELFTFFKLEPSPPANHFVEKPTYLDKIPLDISICRNCNHVQLLQIVEPSYLYSNYFYVSSTSNTMINHLQNNIDKFITNLNISKNDNILEIGANDGVCIKYLLDNGYTNTIGVDPAKNINKRHNLPILCEFFGSHIIPQLKTKYNNFKLIFAFHCCAHIENINDIFYTISNLLDDDGTFIMEVGYFLDVFLNKSFDTIYHEHIDYHTCYGISKFATKFELKLYNIEINKIQGGSIQFYFCKKNKNISINDTIKIAMNNEYKLLFNNYDNSTNWSNLIIQNGRDINIILNAFKNMVKIIVGYGASAKSTTFLHQYKINKNIIDYIVDDNIYKQHHYTPGLNIPIKSYNYLYIERPDYIIILSYNFVEEIIHKLTEFKNKGVRFIIPFPEIKII